MSAMENTLAAAPGKRKTDGSGTPEVSGSKSKNAGAAEI